MAADGSAHTAPAIIARAHSPRMASWLTIGLVLLILGLLFGVGMFVTAGKVILLVVLVLLLLGVLGGAFYRGRRANV